MKTKVLFLGTFQYAPDGISIITYKKGEEREISEKCLSIAVQLGKVKIIEDKKRAPEETEVVDQVEIKSEKADAEQEQNKEPEGGPEKADDSDVKAKDKKTGGRKRR